MTNFYLLYGTDKSIIQNELNKIIKKLNIKDLIKYSLDNTKIEDIIEDASTISMFSNQKIIIIENANFFGAGKTIENLDQLENYLTKYNQDSFLIFITNQEKIDTRKKITKTIKQIGQIIECNKQDLNYITEYIKDYLKENNYTMEDINYFINITGKNLSNIKNELDKLFMYKLETKTITNQDIDQITIKTLEDEIFSLTDAIILKNTTKSLSLLEEFLNQNYDEIQILILLANQFRFLYQVKRLLNKNKNYSEIAKILEANPYRVKFTIKKLYAYSEYQLLEYIKKLAQIDHDIKLGLMNKRLALELFILQENN